MDIALNSTNATVKLIPRIIIVLLLFIVFLCFYERISDTTPISAIVVLVGGLLDDGSVPKHTELRLEKAKESYFTLTKFSKRKVSIITLSGGTPHKPNPLNGAGFPILEATAAAKALIDYGIPPQNVYEECFSLDTIGNVKYMFFLLSIYVL